ncbi:phosphoribosyl transferase [Guyparkeria hydrothermalis]|uniref:phosphoribosyltransferase n=1 Tax=Guyparkeria TaxID=2035712 RepID=UPI0010AB9B1B|nr:MULTISPECIES: phosphoribosyltransferase family protein [Guyparkeria]MCL7750118.1 phosphoribosyl transferase [Guyparkeria hydrothermalis]TKA89224.1 phosphoribosyl transferase [Guyparkeria sp. SB14A]
MRFSDRREAGRQLAEALERFRGQPGVVYALPRGGVALGVEVARYLDMPLDVLIPRKIGHPMQPEYAICAVPEQGERVCNPREEAAVDPGWLADAESRERVEASRRRALYGRADAPSVDGKLAIIVDDGIATGLTMRAAIRDADARDPARVVVAIPVVPASTAATLEREADELVALEITDQYLGAVGAYYDHFPQVTDDEVIGMLQQAVGREAGRGAMGHGGTDHGY